MQFHYPFFFHEQHSLQDMFYGCSVPRQHYLHFLTNEGSPQKNKSQGCEKFLSKARLKATFESKQFDLHESPPGKQYELPCFLVPSWSLIATKGPWELTTIPSLQGLWAAAHAKHQDCTKRNHNPRQSQPHKTLSLSQVGNYCVISHPDSNNIHLINPFLQSV